MRRKGLLGVVAAAILIAGCGGDDDDDRTAEAQQVVNDALAAFADKDFEEMCELQDQRANDAITELGKADTCAEGYEVIFAKQGEFVLEGGQPFDEFIAQLTDYEAGEVTFVDEESYAAEVELVGPKTASSFLADEDGELKVMELFVTPNPNEPNQGFAE